MTAGYRLTCVRCAGCQPGTGYLTACRECGGLLDAGYDLGRARIGPAGQDPFRRFGDLLPAVPAAFPATSEHGIASTPLVALEPGVYAKWEGGHPTGSAKDPMAIVALAHMRTRGVRAFVFSSTGNTTAAFARALAFWPDITGHVFVPAGFPPPACPPPNLVVHEVPGDYAAAHHAAARHAGRHDRLVPEGGFFSVGRREGLKLAYLAALLDAPAPPTVVVQAVSSGMGILAAGKAAAELTSLGLLPHPPRLIAVQQESCAPMVASFLAGAEALRPGDVVPDPDGPAVATLLGDPSASYPYVRDAVLASGGALAATSAADIGAAYTHARWRLGLDVCFAAATALGALPGLRRAGLIRDGDVVLVNLTGSARSAAGQRELARLASSGVVSLNPAARAPAPAAD
jgi:threonine synthase